MEDKKSHIDSFLEEKLRAFEASPDEQAWQAIVGNIAHLQHPIDLSVNNHLSGLSDDSKSADPSVLNNALEAHPIDLSLREKLDMLEAFPDHTAMGAILAEGNVQKRKRRIAAWYLGSLFLAIGLGLMISGQYWLKDRNTYSTKAPGANTRQEPVNSTRANGSHKKAQMGTGNNQFLSEDNNRTYASKSIINGGVFKLRKVGDVLYHTAEYQSPIDEASLEMIRPYPDFGMRHDPGLELVTPLKNTMRIVPAKKLSPFSLHLQAGYLNQTSLSDRQEANNIHKDAEGNFEKASGHAMNGSLYSLQAAWAFRRFSLRCGLQYSTSTVTSQFDYVYNQLPLYDSMGNLVDYIVRPYAQSPHIHEQVKTSSTGVSVPVQLYMQLGHIGRIGLWGGIGSDLVLSRKVSGRLFSYDDEGMKDYTASKRFGLSPHLSLMGQYRVKAGLALTINMQYAYSTEHISFENAKFTRQQFIPSLRLGLLFTPIVRIK